MSFTPSPVELALVAQIFAKADPQKIGILTGDAALKVFGGAKLPPTVLGEIWSIADEDNNGWLPRKGVAIAVRLMGWAQKGEKVTEALVTRRECTFNLAVGILMLTISRYKSDLCLLLKAFKHRFHNRTLGSRCPSLPRRLCRY
jgi:hypothetical protein